MPKDGLKLSKAGYLGSVLGTGLVTLLLGPFHEQLNTTTTALAFLLVVLFVALFWGSGPALLASVLGMFAFNFFFLPPLYTLSIAHAENWVALLTFFTTALVVGQLSARARKRADEAESRKREIERLYGELQEAFERASQAEALRRSEKLKSALLDAVTHDLRTPLTSIKASITTILDEARGKIDGEQPVTLDRESRLEMLEIIDEETDRLNRFISGLIELARIEAGELQLRRNWGEVDEIISAALQRAESITRGRLINVNIERELPVVRVDERSVSEVLYTLIDNASKYSPPGTAIDIRAELGPKDTVRITVEDRGKGVSVALRERVFDKFFRATRDGDIRTHQPSGSGMGLAIAKGIVEAHEGKIWIESGSDGVGTRVVFTLPIGDDEIVASVPEAETSNERKRPYSGSR
jgi:two-component system sensor histidine kinase KdpD